MEHVVDDNGAKADVVFDCRGMGLKQTPAGAEIYPVSGQTVLLHAPADVEFDGIVGNPGSEVSYNLVPWAKVTAEIVEMLGLEGKVDPSAGGTLVLIGATKDRLDYNWIGKSWLVPGLIDGAAKLDPRVRDWKPVLIRKGMRSNLPKGILDQRTLNGDTVVRSLAGWGGAAYCGSFPFAEEVVGEEVAAFNATGNFAEAGSLTAC